MRLVFAGTPDFAAPTLAALAAGRHPVELVLTQPDRPAGRGRTPTPPPVKALALRLGLRVIQPESINAPEAVEVLRTIAPDALIVMAYGVRLRARVLRVPRLGCLNVHASLLPRYRGAAPINWAIICGERETGVTLQRMASEIDCGAILTQRATAIGEEETAGELYERLSALAAEMIGPALDELEAGRLIARPQDDARATDAPKLEKRDGRVDWSASPIRTRDFIRGMTPWPGAFTWHHHSSGAARRLILLAARPIEGIADAPPGTVLRASDELHVAAGGGRLRILRLQSEGARPMDAADWLRGHAVAAGDRFGPGPGEDT